MISTQKFFFLPSFTEFLSRELAVFDRKGYGGSWIVVLPSFTEFGYG